MTSQRGDRLAGRLEQRAKALAAAEAELAGPPAVARAKRTGPVRQTVDIPAGTHDRLGLWLAHTAVALGVRRVTTQAALAALIELMLEDKEVERRLRERLAE